jgi:broad specificity phosphatase PhoE
MRIIEHRRHTMRAKPGQHLTQAGVTLARRVGEGIGPFNRVITSTVPRTFETAIAMGFAVDEERDVLAQMSPDVEAEIRWPAAFSEIGRVMKAGGAAAMFGDTLARLLKAVAEALPADGAALIISHGGIVEAAAVACLLDADHAAWGAHCGYCEGVRLVYDAGRFIHGEILRVS